ncbi:MAG: RNase adapter RapZ, partial [Vulcanimicrobiota bacterium]
STCELMESLQILSDLNFKTLLIYFDATNDELVRRFSANYRRHPRLKEGKRTLEAIREERVAQKDIRGMADKILDTSDKTVHQLKEEITRLFFKSEDGAYPITITIMSFGYKYGIPRDVDLLFDARVLPNPFYDLELQPLDGTNEKIQKFVFKEKKGNEFLNRICELVDFLLPQYITKGKSHLTIGIGCTGGQHRSVAVADKIASYLKEKKYQVFEQHRDIVTHT